MLKIIRPSGCDEATTTLLKVARGRIDRAQTEKHASLDVFGHLDLVPEAGHHLVHVVAMGASDAYGGNRNADSYYETSKELNLPAPDWSRLRCANGTIHTKCAEHFASRTNVGLKETHPTFVSNAHVFREHRNKPERGDKIWGQVKASAYNGAMRRVQLVLSLPDKDWGSELEDIANDRPVTWSMACGVPYDVCEYCGHKAIRREFYCEHLARGMTDMLADGHIMKCANDHMNFCDISHVAHPADVIAHTLGHLKAASLRDLATNQLVYPYAEEEAPDYTGAVTKFAIIQRMSAMEKRVPMYTAAAAGAPVDKAGEVPKTIAGKLPKVAAFLRCSFDRDILLPPTQFAELVAGDVSPEIVKQAKALLPAAYTRLLDNADSVLANQGYTPKYANNDPGVAAACTQLERNCAVSHNAASARIISRTDTPTQKTASLAASPAAIALAENYLAYQIAFVKDAATRGKEAQAMVACVLINNFS
jgi:hypothetical protein